MAGKLERVDKTFLAATSVYCRRLARQAVAYSPRQSPDLQKQA